MDFFDKFNIFLTPVKNWVQQEIKNNTNKSNNKANKIKQVRLMPKKNYDYIKVLKWVTNAELRLE